MFLNKLTVSVWRSLLWAWLACSFASQGLAHSGHKHFKILVLSARHSNGAKVTLLTEAAKQHDIIVERKNESELAELDDISALLNPYDLVLLGAVSKRFTQQYYGKYAATIAGLNTRVVAIGDPDSTSLNANIKPQHIQGLAEYYRNGGEQNFARMAAYLKHRIFQPSEKYVAEAIIFPDIGIYHPDYKNLIFDTLEDYQTHFPQFASQQAKVGIMLQRSLVESAQTAVVDEFIRQLGEKNIGVLPFFFQLSPKVSDYSHLLQQNGETLVDAIVSFRSIHWANQRKVEFENFGVPVIQALTYFNGDQQAWEQDVQGIAAGSMPFVLVLPETAGVIDPTVVAAVNPKTEKAEPIAYQLSYLAERLERYTQLKYKPNAEKKLTMMFWGDQDMGASFLNVPESMRAISAALSDNGYQVNKVEAAYFTDRVHRVLNPFFREYELDTLLQDDLAALFPVAKYRAWLETLPKEVVAPITEYWGEPENNFMVVEREGEAQFVIPRIRNGNLLIMRQPPRGDDKNQEQSLFHTTTVPMNHYYLAAYLYAREAWQSDAFIHLGTHGSQEYLPGKERGLSRYDGGPLSVGSLPVFYPFIVDDVGEAVQTKRRGSAVPVSHMTPPYAAAGLQGVTADLHALMHEYKALDEGGVKQKTADQISQRCIKENLCKDFGWDKARIKADFAGFLEALHFYLDEVAAENQPLGLHSFGELPERPWLISSITQMLGAEFIAAATEYESQHYTQQHDSQHYTQQQVNQSNKAPNPHLQTTEMPLQNLPGFKVVRDFVVAEGDLTPLGDELAEFIQRGREYYKNMLGIREMQNLIAGLSGQYIAVNTGGDPIRHPESLPTGLNLYGFDPARLPTKAAFAQGKELVEGVISDYYQQHGKYPDKLAFSLWSIEAMRHFGVLEGQALYAMGVEPVWSEDGRVIDTHIIPASELKRPRVDVVLSATGLYRDAFPNVMQWMAQAVQQVAELKEEGNSLWDNAQRIKADLIAEGLEADEAQYLSTVRIFSNISGDYGSGVDGPVFNSDTWESDGAIADNYLSRMGYFYGADNSKWGEAFAGLYAKQLSGTDVALFSRSSNLYGMITSDDPFEYFGSLSLAVRKLDGKSPEMMISNLRNASKARMETTATFMAKELRTRNFNKRWIQAMQQEGYSGAVTLASNLRNFWGWQVVDPNTVRSDQWQDFFEIYVEDRLQLDMEQFFEQINPQSQKLMVETMLEAIRKNYWPASDDVKKTLIERYDELIKQFDLAVDNQKLREFVQQQSAGFGLSFNLPAPESPATVVEAASGEMIAGQKLEKQPTAQNEPVKHYLEWILAACCLCVVVLGALRQASYVPKATA